MPRKQEKTEPNFESFFIFSIGQRKNRFYCCVTRIEVLVLAILIFVQNFYFNCTVQFSSNSKRIMDGNAIDRMQFISKERRVSCMEKKKFSQPINTQTRQNRSNKKMLLSLKKKDSRICKVGGRQKNKVKKNEKTTKSRDRLLQTAQ